jgi:preprotein translocase subunit SecE
MAQYVLLAMLALLLILVAVYWRKFQAMGLAFKKFLREVRVEMQKVSWPSTNDVIGAVIVVLVAVVMVTIIVSVSDEVLSKILDIVLQRKGA